MERGIVTWTPSAAMAPSWVTEPSRFIPVAAPQARLSRVTSRIGSQVGTRPFAQLASTPPAGPSVGRSSSSGGDDAAALGPRTRGPAEPLDDASHA